MRKKIIAGISLVIILLFAVITIGILFAAKDKIVYDVPYGKVTFNHSTHATINCLKCHHDWRPSQTSGKLCKDCHKARTEGKAPSTKEAFHKNCKGCHDELKKAGKPIGPSGCKIVTKRNKQKALKSGLSY